MARSDLLLDLVKAERSSDRARFRSLVEAVISEERAKSHHVLADRLAALISTNGTGAPKAVNTRPHSSAINDLLHEIDQMSFVIHETNREVKAKHRPVVLITSNAEKELPDAFLRRCVFHYIQFPDEALMRRIVEVHYPDLEEALLSQCLTRFYWLRDQDNLRKKPSTSELIDWIGALMRAGLTEEKLAKELPLIGVLIKKERDLATLGKLR